MERAFADGAEAMIAMLLRTRFKAAAGAKLAVPWPAGIESWQARAASPRVDVR
jgi:hypothetical protein